jgi:hypothetical protein
MKQGDSHDTLPSVDSPDRWATRYEDLRRHAVEKESSTGWGAALLMQRGTVAWMKAWPANDESLAAGGSGPVAEKEVCGVLVDVPAVLCREAILVLVDMIVKRCREEAA